MRHTIRSDAHPVYTVCETDEEQSVLQNLALLIATRTGTVPMYREFGLPFAFEHCPRETMETVAAAELANAIETFEPRASYRDVRFEFREDDPADYVMIVEVET